MLCLGIAAHLMLQKPSHVKNLKQMNEITPPQRNSNDLRKGLPIKFAENCQRRRQLLQGHT